MVTLSVASLIGLLVVIPIGLSVFAYKFERKILDEIEKEVEEVEEIKEEVTEETESVEESEEVEETPTEDNQLTMDMN